MPRRPSSEEFVVAGVSVAWVGGFAHSVPVAAAVVAALSAVGLLIRTRHPVTGAAIVLGGVPAGALLGVPSESPAIMLPLFVVVYGLGRRAAAPWIIPAFGVIIGVPLYADEQLRASWADIVANLAFAGFVIGGIWGFGRMVRHRTTQARRSRQRADELVRQDPARVAAAVVTEERSRLAVDIISVVEEAVTGMLHDVDQAQTRKPFDPSLVERARRRGAAGVAELRRLLGLLRDDVPAMAAPVPTAAAPVRYRPVDLALTFVLLVGATFEVALGPAAELPSLWFLTAVQIGVVAIRRTHPAVACLIAAATIALAGLLAPSPNLHVQAVALGLLAWSAAVRGGPVAWSAVAGLAAIDLALTYLVDPLNVAIEAAVFAVPLLAGRAWSEESREHMAAERAADQTQARLDCAVADALRSERLRVARELHDVTSHALGVMVVQAGAAQAQLASDHVRAHQCLTLLEQAGRQALLDLGRLLNVIDAGALGSVVSKQPTEDSLDSRLRGLIERVEAAGLRVSPRLDRLPEDPAVAQTVYRIVQESLTNAVRHAPGSRVDLQVSPDEGGWKVAVRDDGKSFPSAGSTAGFGLIGAAERVHALGGEFSAGPRPEGGFQLTASIPNPARRLAGSEAGLKL